MARSSDAQGAVDFFDVRETDYLQWIRDYPDGFVANMDRAGCVPHYPMIHRAHHRLMWRPKIGNFTTGDYVKFCSLDLRSLAARLSREFGKKPTYCGTCMAGQGEEGNGTRGSNG